MRYTELKNRLKYLKKLKYEKFGKGIPCYRKIFAYREWRMMQAVSEHDIVYSHDFYDYLLYLEDKNIMALMAYGTAEK